MGVYLYGLNEMNVNYFWVSGMGLTLRLRLFVCDGLFMTGWETFMGCVCVKMGIEHLRLDECGLTMMSGELEGS